MKKIIVLIFILLVGCQQKPDEATLKAKPKGEYICKSKNGSTLSIIITDTTFQIKDDDAKPLELIELGDNKYTAKDAESTTFIFYPKEDKLTFHSDVNHGDDGAVCEITK